GLTAPLAPAGSTTSLAVTPLLAADAPAIDTAPTNPRSTTTPAIARRIPADHTNDRAQLRTPATQLRASDCAALLLIAGSGSGATASAPGLFSRRLARLRMPRPSGWRSVPGRGCGG